MKLPTSIKVLLAFIIGVGFVLSACQPATGTQTESETATELLEVVIEATEWGFTPSSVNLVAGQPVKITLINNGQIVHDVTIPNLPFELLHKDSEHGHAAPADAIHIHTEPGDIASVTFVPLSGGAYDFTCSIAGHSEAGMVGTFMVAGEAVELAHESGEADEHGRELEEAVELAHESGEADEHGHDD